MAKKEWWAKGIQFECQGSGKCCVSRDEYGFVYLTDRDRRRFAKYFKLSMREFTAKYCEKDQGHFWKLKDFTRSCVFLKNNQCSVYEARPTQCRTWPFWPENMSAKNWKRDVASYCPGVGKGRVWTEEEIRQQIEAQQESEDEADILQSH